MTQSKSTAASRARAALRFASALVSAAGGGTDLQMYVRAVHHGQSGLIHAHYNAGCFRREYDRFGLRHSRQQAERYHTIS